MRGVVIRIENLPTEDGEAPREMERIYAVHAPYLPRGGNWLATRLQGYDEAIPELSPDEIAELLGREHVPFVHGQRGNVLGLAMRALRALHELREVELREAEKK